MQNDGGRALPEALVSAIYDAALEPGRWPDVLARLARFADDSMASLLSVETGGTMREVLCNVDPDLQGRLVEYLPENLDYQRRHRAQPGEAILGEALATADEMRRTAAYADIFRPSGAIHFCGVSLPMHGDRFHPLPCTADRNRARSASAGGSGYLSPPPHFARAAKIAARIGRTEAWVETLETALAAAPCAIFVLARDRRVLSANQVVEAPCGAAGPLALDRGGHLSGQGAGRHRRVRAFLGHVAARPDAHVLRLPPSGDGDGITLHAAPLAPGRVASLASGSEGARLLIALSERGAPLPPELLRALYGLTDAGARLAAAIATGVGPAPYADRVGVARETAKTHLGRVFAETGTCRQSDLARLIARLEGAGRSAAAPLGRSRPGGGAREARAPSAP